MCGILYKILQLKNKIRGINETRLSDLVILKLCDEVIFCIGSKTPPPPTEKKEN